MAAKRKGVKKKPKKRKIDGETKFLAFLGIFLPMVGYLINLIIRHDDDYVMYYSKQGLVLFVFGLILELVVVLLQTLIINLTFLDSLLWIFLVIIWVVGWMNALSGEKKSTIIIGDLVEKVGL